VSSRRRNPRQKGDPETAADSTTGCVVEAYGRRVVVLTTDTGERVASKIRGRRVELVAGDEVRLQPEAAGGDEWVVTERLPRRNVLQRTDSQGMDESVAANLDQLGVVVAPRPACDPFLIDRYLAGAAYAGIAPLLILNKEDLIGGEFNPADFDFIETYRRIGIPVVTVSAKKAIHLDALIEQLRGKRTLLAGQSGVGKSSLTNALCGGTARVTSDLSAGTGEGRHTTVSSAVIQLPWGELTDSPGVRDYAPPVVPLADVQRGYVEIAGHTTRCRFQDCLHLREPHCAIQAAADAGRIDPRRLESYRRLLNLTRQLIEKRGWRS
jgi:ribosome biogenesis GTPase